MTAFSALKTASKKFEEELTRVSNELFSAKIEEPFEDVIAKKLCDLSLYNAKLRLLRAKPLSLTPQISQLEHDKDTTLEAYGETVANRLIEQQLAKYPLQANAVKALITAPDSSLDTELIEKKQKILEAMFQYRIQEDSVQRLETLLKEKEDKLADLRDMWAKELELYHEVTRQAAGPEEEDHSPLYQKLAMIVSKLEMMRWLAGRLMPRSRTYDWLADPQRRLQVVKMTREPFTIDKFLNS